MQRALIFVLSSHFIVLYLLNEDFKAKIANFPFRIGIKTLGISLLLVTLFSKMPFFSSLFNYISILVEYLIIFVLVWNVFESEDEIKNVFDGLFISFLVITFYGLFTKIFQVNPYLNLVNTEGFRDISFSYDDIVRGNIFGRIQSVFYHPISYGGFMALLMPFVFWRIFHADYDIKNILLYLLIILLVLNIFLTNSRSPIIFVLIALSGFIFTKQIKNIIKYGIPLIGVVFILMILSGSLNDYFTTIKGAVFFWDEEIELEIGGSSILSRELALLTALGYFLQHPFTGHGLTMLREIVKFQTDPFLGNAPSFLFELLVDTGLAGIVGYSVLFSNILLKYKGFLSTNLSEETLDLIKITITTIIGYIVFINITGELNTFSFFLILVALTSKYCQLSQNNILMSNEA